MKLESFFEYVAQVLNFFALFRLLSMLLFYMAVYGTLAG